MARPEILLVYDDQCPACDNYCRLVRSCGNLLLKMLRKAKINNLGLADNARF